MATKTPFAPALAFKPPVISAPVFGITLAPRLAPAPAPAPTTAVTRAPLFTLPTPESILSGPNAIVRSYAQHVVAAKAAKLGTINVAIDASPADWAPPSYDPTQPPTNYGGVNPDDWGQDNQLLASIQGKAASLITSTGLFQDVQTIWAGAETGFIAGAAAGATIAIAAAVLSSYGFAALAQILELLVGAIAQAIVNALIAAGIADISIATAAGSSFGFVGAVIGAVIGACIALGNLLTGGPHLQIEDGRTYSVSDYVSKNMSAASTFLTNAKSLVGVTPLWMATTFGLFIANPTWLYSNQNHFPGHGQPVPPDQGTGKPLDLAYTELPGAFEMLNRAQYAAACGLMMTTSQKGDFYSSIPTPGDVTPDPDENNYAPFLSATPQTWAFGLPYQSGTLPNGVECNDGFLYASCPNLWTNNSVVVGDLTAGTHDAPGGKVTKQTDISPGIYAIQVLYPSLTRYQALLLFTQAKAQYDNLQLANRMAGDLAGFVQGGSSVSNNTSPTGGTDGAPLPPSAIPTAPAPVTAPLLGASGMTFGPIAGSLSGLTLGGFLGGWSPPSTPLTPAQSAQMTAAQQAGIAAAKALAANPPATWALPGPLTPTQAVALLGAANAAKIGVVVPTPASTAHAVTTVHGIVAGANAGHPVSVANAKLLDQAQRLSIQAQWATHYFGPTVAAGILAANPSALPVGTGKYDKNLPLILEQTVDASLADPARTKTGLQQFATALYQLP